MQQSFFPAPSGSNVQPWHDDPNEQVKHYDGWAYVAANAIAFKIASTPLRLYRRQGDEREEITDHPFLDLIHKANARDTDFDFWSESIIFLFLTGNAYWFKQRGAGGLPEELWILPSQHMHVIPDPKTIVGGYRYKWGKIDETLPIGDVVHLRYPNPDSLYYGRSPVQAAAYSIDNTDDIRGVQKSSFANGTRFGSVFVPEDAGIDEDTLERFYTRLAQHYAEPERARKPFVAPAGVKPHKLDWSPAELDFLNSGIAARNEALGIMGTPPAVLGVSGDVNRATAWAMRDMFARFTIEPIGRGMIEKRMNEDLLPDFGDPELVCEFGSFVPRDQDAEQKNWEIALRHGAPLNRYMAWMGEDPVPGGDVGVITGMPVPLTDLATDGSGTAGKRTALQATQEADTGRIRQPDGQKAGRLSAARRRKLEALIARVLRPIETQCRKRLNKYFKQERNLVIAQLRKSLATRGAVRMIAKDAASDFLDQLTGDIDWLAQAEAMRQAALPAIASAITAGAKIEATLDGMEVMFGLEDPRAGQYLKRDRGTEYWKNGPINTTIDRIHSTLAKGMEMGEGLPELSARVAELYDEQFSGDTGRAQLIASTEVGEAQSLAGREQVTASGLPYKMWIADPRATSRPGHAAADGEVVAMDEHFSNGLMWAKAPGNGPAENCNCHCNTVGAMGPDESRE